MFRGDNLNTFHRTITEFTLTTDYLFQYCQKIAVFDGTKVLLCKRQNEVDYDGVFSFIGGKMERGDKSIIEGLRREKNEELGADFTIEVLSWASINFLFQKQDGNSVILPHYYARYISGEIKLSDEYSEYRWVELDELSSFQPLITNIPDAARDLYRLQLSAQAEDFEMI